jgi:hypothetical protein
VTQRKNQQLLRRRLGAFLPSKVHNDHDHDRHRHRCRRPPACHPSSHRRRQLPVTPARGVWCIIIGCSLIQATRVIQRFFAFDARGFFEPTGRIFQPQVGSLSIFSIFFDGPKARTILGVSARSVFVVTSHK